MCVGVGFSGVGWMCMVAGFLVIIVAIIILCDLSRGRVPRTRTHFTDLLVFIIISVTIIIISVIVLILALKY